MLKTRLTKIRNISELKNQTIYKLFLGRGGGSEVTENSKKRGAILTAPMKRKKP